jgi:hypothetical protein
MASSSAPLAAPGPVLLLPARPSCRDGLVMVMSDELTG